MAIKQLAILAACAAALSACAQQQQQWHWERAGATDSDFYRDRGQCNAQAFGVPGGSLLQVVLVQHSCLQGKGWEKVSG
jgi:hypothetical protein